MVKAAILTPVLGTGEQDSPYRPELIEDYNITWADITNYTETPQDPKIMTIEIEAPALIVDDIESNNKYFVVWRDDQ